MCIFHHYFYSCNHQATNPFLFRACALNCCVKSSSSPSRSRSTRRRNSRHIEINLRTRCVYCSQDYDQDFDPYSFDRYSVLQWHQRYLFESAFWHIPELEHTDLGFTEVDWQQTGRRNSLSNFDGEDEPVSPGVSIPRQFSFEAGAADTIESVRHSESPSTSLSTSSSLDSATMNEMSKAVILEIDDLLDSHTDSRSDSGPTPSLPTTNTQPHGTSISLEDRQSLTPEPLYLPSKSDSPGQQSQDSSDSIYVPSTRRVSSYYARMSLLPPPLTLRRAPSPPSRPPSPFSLPSPLYPTPSLFLTRQNHHGSTPSHLEEGRRRRDSRNNSSHSGTPDPGGSAPIQPRRSSSQSTSTTFFSDSTTYTNAQTNTGHNDRDHQGDGTNSLSVPDTPNNAIASPAITASETSASDTFVDANSNAGSPLTQPQPHPPSRLTIATTHVQNCGFCQATMGLIGLYLFVRIFGS